MYEISGATVGTTSETIGGITVRSGIVQIAAIRAGRAGYPRLSATMIGTASATGTVIASGPGKTGIVATGNGRITSSAAPMRPPWRRSLLWAIAIRRPTKVARFQHRRTAHPQSLRPLLTSLRLTLVDGCRNSPAGDDSCVHSARCQQSSDGCRRP